MEFRVALCLGCKADRDGRNIPDINNKELEKHFSDILIKLKDI